MSAASQDAGARRGLGLPIAIFASAQFVMVLDSSVMNVSISQIVDDLDTTVQGVQGAITFYTLVMASLMLLGAKLGDVLGRSRCFAIGLAVYGLGSLTTALSPNLTVLLIGWSTIEGIGAAMVIPAIMSLIVAMDHGDNAADAGAIAGFVQGGGYLLAAVLPFVAGLLREHLADLTPAWWLMAALCLVLAAVAVPLRPGHRISFQN